MASISAPGEAIKGATGHSHWVMHTVRGSGEKWVCCESNEA